MQESHNIIILLMLTLQIFHTMCEDENMTLSSSTTEQLSSPSLSSSSPLLSSSSPLLSTKTTRAPRPDFPLLGSWRFSTNKNSQKCVKSIVAENKCPPEFFYYKGNCLLHTEVRQSWEDAYRRCSQYGASLPSTHEADYCFLEKLKDLQETFDRVWLNSRSGVKCKSIDLFQDTNLQTEDSNCYIQAFTVCVIDADLWQEAEIVKFSPSFARQMGNGSYEIEEGRSMRLTCSTSAYPVANIKIYKESESQVKSILNTSVTRNTEKVRCSDSGVYICKAWNVYNNILYPVQIHIKVKCIIGITEFTINNEERHVFVRQNSTPQFRCKSQLYQNPSVVLYKDEIGKNVIYQKDMNILNYGMTSVGCRDMGTYVCQARDNEGPYQPDIKSIELGVMNCAPRLCDEENVSKYDGTPGKPLSISFCVVSGSKPQVKINNTRLRDLAIVRENSLQVDVVETKDSQIFFTVHIHIKAMTEKAYGTWTLNIEVASARTQHTIEFVKSTAKFPREVKSVEGGASISTIVPVVVVIVVISVVVVIVIILLVKQKKRKEEASEEGEEEGRYQSNKADSLDNMDGRTVSADGLIYVTIDHTREMKDAETDRQKKINFSEQVTYVEIDLDKMGHYSTKEDLENL